MVDEDIGAERSRPEVADGGGPVFFIAESPMNCLLQRPRRVAKRAGGGEVRRTDSVSRDAASSSIGIFPAALSSFYFPLIAEPQLPPLPSLCLSLSSSKNEAEAQTKTQQEQITILPSFLPSVRSSVLPFLPFPFLSPQSVPLSSFLRLLPLLLLNWRGTLHLLPPLLLPQHHPQTTGLPLERRRRLLLPCFSGCCCRQTEQRERAPDKEEEGGWRTWRRGGNSAFQSL